MASWSRHRVARELILLWHSQEDHLLSKGHSPSSAHLEYETNLMYKNKPQLLADRNINRKISDVYNIFNKWRKDNLGIRTGKELFIELEKWVNIYNEKNKDIDGKASVQRFCKNEGKDDDQPLILAICTPLMSRVHRYIQRSGKLVFIDSSSSFDDYNIPCLSYLRHHLLEGYL